MPRRNLAAIISAYDGVVLVLQGGGALGAYQAGVFEALSAHRIEPDWVAGVSIGAINAALIAGNKPQDRSPALKGFWTTIASSSFWGPMEDILRQFAGADEGRLALAQFSAGMTLIAGQPNFFQPRIPPPWLHLPGSIEATSFYDTTPLRQTLLDFVDFDYLNAGHVRISVGAVNVRNGNFLFFDSAKQRIEVEHIMASGALPPGFPAVEIDGDYYWDGGVVSNTPLLYVTDERPRRNILVFQVDLWSAKGEMPRDLAEVDERRKDIAYSSRTRLNTDTLEYQQCLRNNIHSLLDKLPKSLLNEPEIAVLRAEACPALINIMHLIYRQKHFERDSKDYEFSAQTMQDHWRSGHDDTMATLRHIDWFEMPKERVGVVTHDIHRRSA